jgi:opacity protein-like surface antigen
MKKVALALFASMAMALGFGGAAKADLFDYAKLYGGATLEPKLAWCDPGCFDYDMDTGFNVGGALGWDVAPELSIEVDMMYTQSAYSCCDTRLETFSAMVNGIWHFDIDSKWRPYIGAGIGGVQSIYEFPGGNSDDFVFGAQGLIGVDIAIAEKLDLELGYKYQWADDASADGLTWEYKSHNLDLGLVIHL